jgi:uncharacterized protein
MSARRQVAVLVVLLILLAGCPRSPSPRLHTLSTLPPEPRPAVVETAVTLVAVGPVTLPDYLDHPALTVRTGPNEISRSGLDRWASPLGQEVVRAAAANLAVLLDSTTVKVLPWAAVANPDFRIQIAIQRFEREDGRVVLNGDWGLIGPERDGWIAAGQTTVTSPAPVQDSGGTTAAMSAALTEMCRRIAAEVKEMLHTQN